MKADKILLLGASFATDNMGVGALTAGALTIVKKIHTGANISFLDYGVDSKVYDIEIEGQVVSVPLINLRFSKKIFLPNNIIRLLFLSVLLRLIGQNACKTLIERNIWLRVVCESDVAFAVSGGDSFSDIYGLGRFFYVSLPQLLLTILGKKLYLLPQSIGPFKGRLSKLVARFIMKRAEIIYCRDFGGIHEARTLLKVKDEEPKVRFSYDMGFVLESHKPQYVHLMGFENDRQCTKPLIGLNISGLLYMGGYNRRNMFQLKVNYKQLIDKIISFLIDVKKANILLIPHVFGYQDESDVTAIRAVYLRLKERYPNELYSVYGSYDQSEIKYIIGLCDLFIGSRMHACIAAISQSIPTVGIAYSQKFAGVFETINMGALVADPRLLTIDETIDKISTAFADRYAIGTHLKSILPGVRENVLNLLNEFR